MTVRGADPATVRRAIETRTPLPGTAGFAGRLDGRLVRDVLGREPLFVDPESGGWGHDPTTLADPQPVPAGTVRGNGKLRRVWTLPDPDPPEDPVRAVRGALEAVLGDVDPEVPVAFSGGVDSALVAAHTEGPLYAAGFPGSDDLAAAREGARLLDRELRVVELDHDRLESLVPAVVTATGRTNPMDVAIAVPLVAAARRAAADGFDRLAVGQGADELFGGYDKVARAPGDPRVEADTVDGARREVVRSLPEGLSRDVLALRDAGVEPVAPLLHDRVVGAALSLDGGGLVRCGERKWTLRLAARTRVPDRLAFRPKRAVQYGSDVADELDRLARRAGFKRRQEDHLGRYVESLVGGA